LRDIDDCPDGIIDKMTTTTTPPTTTTTTTTPPTTTTTKKKRRSKCKYLFRLGPIDVLKISSAYGIGAISNISFQSSANPDCTTGLNELSLTTSQEPDKISFFDAAKRHRHCLVLSQFSNSSWCWWCKHSSDGPLYACPLSDNPATLKKTYKSTISKTVHVLKDAVASTSTTTTTTTVDDGNIEVETPTLSYVTTGTFCSFNCVVSYILDNSHDADFDKSLELLSSILLDGGVDTLPPPAPSWKLLKRFGGHLDIESFRKNFNKITYASLGASRSKILYNPVDNVFEERLKF
jgi:hypothetical protein